MRFDKKSKQQQYRVNEEIREREVRIVGEGIESIVLPTRDAIRMAEEKGVDLIEISPNATPPVCRLIEYSRFIYQQKKKAKEMKAKQVKMELKEIRFGPQTAEADYNFKLKHAIGFLKEGNKVKAYVFFKGRSIVFKEQGEVLLLRFANDLEELAKVENMPVLEGKRMSIILSPRKPGQPKKSQQKQDAEREKQKKVLEQQNADAAVQASEPSSVEKSEEISE